MAKPEWGAKRICHNCGTRFYDMHRAEIVCPKCNTTFDPEALLKSRRSRGGFTGEVTPVRPSRSRAKAPVEAEAEAPAAEEEKPVGVGDDEAAEEDADLESVESGEEEFEESEDEESGVLLEDASELGDDDVEIEVEDRDEESR